MSEAGAAVPRLRVSDLVKTFPGVTALDGVSLEIRPGEIRALLGENGAGKSTLGKIIGGVYQADSGTLEHNGERLTALDEATVGKRGIGIVHQEGSLVPQLSVAENIFAGRQPTKAFGVVDRKRMRAQAAELLARLGVNFNPATPVRQLSSAQAQVVEIAKALSQNLNVLILDEPTAALTLNETNKLFDIVHQLAADGVSVIYVSHRLAEIFQLCHTVTVLKDGHVTGVRQVAETSTDELIRLMVGRDIHFGREGTGRAFGNVRLAVEHLASATDVRDATFSVRAGEIVCLAGLVGSGRTETCEVIFGARARTAGTVSLHGQPVTFTGPWDAIKTGIGMVPEDRKDGGLFLGMDIARNISATALHKVSSRGLISEAASLALANRFIRDLRIATPSAHRAVGDLSGGNQQKVLIAKWLAMGPEVLIVDEPTRGVDVGARSEIYRILRDLAGQGLALLVVSSDLPEVLTLADRIVVMAEGRTVGELDGASASEEAVLRLATRFTHLDQVPENAALAEAS